MPATVTRSLWGAGWIRDGSEPEFTHLDAKGQSSGLLAGELTADDKTDIVRLGRGMLEAAPDLLWVATGERQFAAVELPHPDRFSLAGELVDVDEDGLLDIWITRDVGWAEGGDSILSREGDPQGEWIDIADDLGASLEIDGMGVTIADLDGDRRLDAYVSDLGDNELLRGIEGGFVERFDTGAAHIRPADAPSDIVSSTWGTAALDLNLDGTLDLVLTSGGFPEGAVRNKIDGTEVAVAEQPAVLLGRGDGTFTDVWPSMGIDLEMVGRGLTVADLDNDGDDDIVLVDRRGPVHILRNDTVGHAVVVELEQSCSPIAGQVITVISEAASFQRLLAPHGYASSHGAEVIVGVSTRRGVRGRHRWTRIAGHCIHRSADRRARSHPLRPPLRLTCRDRRFGGRKRGLPACWDYAAGRRRQRRAKRDCGLPADEPACWDYAV